MTKFVGRAIEREKIHAALTSNDLEFVAVWVLIRYGREVAEHFMEITGQRNDALEIQLRHFRDNLSNAFHQGIADHAFFDEAPWLDARRFRTGGSVHTPCSVKMKSPKTGLFIFTDGGEGGNRSGTFKPRWTRQWRCMTV